MPEHEAQSDHKAVARHHRIFVQQLGEDAALQVTLTLKCEQLTFSTWG